MRRTLIIFLVVVASISLFATYKYIYNKSIILDDVKLKQKIDNGSFAIMLEQDDGTYAESQSNTFPTTGYVFNSDKSGCVDVNGAIIENSLTYNNETNKVNVRVNREAACYVYFNKLYTITNLVQNGSFENGLNSWSSIGVTTTNPHSINTTYKKFGNNSVERIASTSGGTNYLTQSLTFIADHTYYFFLYGYTTSSTSQIINSDINSRGGDFELNVTNSSGWLKNGTIVSNYPYSENREISINYSQTSDITYLDGIGMIDLTEAFGAGNEPNKAWCDENIEYFDGTTEVHR